MKTAMTTCAAMLVLVGLTACGGNSEKPGDVSGGYPKCADVWQVGKTVPTGYEGCMQDDEILPALVYACEDDRPFLAHDDKFMGREGEKVEKYDEDLFFERVNAAQKDCGEE